MKSKHLGKFAVRMTLLRWHQRPLLLHRVLRCSMPSMKHVAHAREQEAIWAEGRIRTRRRIRLLATLSKLL